MKEPKANPNPAPERVGVNVRIPAHVHRACRVACAERGVTWDEFAAEAFSAWARQRMQQTR